MRGGAKLWCLVRTREVHAGCKVKDRLDDYSISGVRASLPSPEEQIRHARDNSSLVIAGDLVAEGVIRYVNRPSTPNRSVSLAAVRWLGRQECGLDERSDSWLVNQVSCGNT